MDIDAAFDSILEWENQLITQGEELGIERGRELGVEEGKSLGFAKGAEIGSEIGFYYGCFLVWDGLIKQEKATEKMNARVCKSIASFGSLLEKFELKNIVDEDLLQKLLHIRAKFKAITSMLGIRNELVFSTKDVDAHKNMSF